MFFENGNALPEELKPHLQKLESRTIIAKGEVLYIGGIDEYNWEPLRKEYLNVASRSYRILELSRSDFTQSTKVDQEK
jgi:hypothetical protein